MLGTVVQDDLEQLLQPTPQLRQQLERSFMELKGTVSGRVTACQCVN